MPQNNDNTKKVLEGILSDLYRQAGNPGNAQGSYLSAGQDVFLGRITENRYDNESILNQYGPYGSRYSPTSIFNQYSEFGSRYGQMSMNNPYSSNPPRLIINGRLFAYITENRFLNPKMTPEVFLYNLENNIQGLMRGNLVENESQLRQVNHELFIEGSDGAFLGRPIPNQFDPESIFNQFGTYGSQFSPTSIFNQFGTYGSQFSQLSPYNLFSNQPPKMYVNGKFIAYITKNQFLRPAIDPDNLKEWINSNITKY